MNTDDDSSIVRKAPEVDINGEYLKSWHLGEMKRDEHMLLISDCGSLNEATSCIDRLYRKHISPEHFKISFTENRPGNLRESLDKYMINTLSIIEPTPTSDENLINQSSKPRLLPSKLAMALVDRLCPKKYKKDI